MMRERLQMMSDILSVSRYLILNETPPSLSGASMTEGFEQPSQKQLKLFEAFSTTQTTVNEQKKLLAKKDLFTLKQRAIDASKEQNVYASRQLNLYAIMNIVAVGIIFYIMSV
jgi:hypothetical protein